MCSTACIWACLYPFIYVSSLSLLSDSNSKYFQIAVLLFSLANKSGCWGSALPIMSQHLNKIEQKRQVMDFWGDFVCVCVCVYFFFMLLTDCRRGILVVGRKSHIACGYLVTGEVSQLDVSSRGEKQHKITVGCRRCTTKRQTTYLCLKRVCGTDRQPITLQAFTCTVWLLKIGG